MNYSDIAEASLMEASREYVAAGDYTRKRRHRVSSLLKFYALLYHARTAASISLLNTGSDVIAQKFESSEEESSRGYL